MNDHPLRRRASVAALAVVLITCALWAAPLNAQQQQQDTPATNDDPQQRIDELLHEIEEEEEAAPTEEMDEPAPRFREDIAAISLPREGRLRLMDISLNLMSAVGTSTARDDVLRDLQGGEHDPNRRGFTFQQAELGIGGAVDPLFYGEAYIVFDDDHIELEEGFFVTQSMPWNLQLKGGYFLTEFGRVNAQHPHEWFWIDQPIINTRLFSGEGMRGAGARLGWLAPTPWYSQLQFTVQNADDETMISFLGEGHDHGHGHDDDHDDDEHTIGGLDAIDRDEVRNLRDLVYTLRWANSFDLSDDVTALIGASGMYGPNRSGPRGETWIYGADVTLKWQPAGGVWPFVSWQTEFMQRHFRPRGGVHHDDDDDHHHVGTLQDWGVNSQLAYGFTRNWVAGVRGEYVSGSGGQRHDDPMRADRVRISPLLMWQPTEFTRVRLQYNYDHSDFLNHDHHHERHSAHSVWLGVDLLLGSHPAHPF